MNNNDLKEKYWPAITDCPLFKDIPQNKIDEMLTSLDGYISVYKKNESIIHIGDEFRKCGIILSGSVEISYDTNKFEKHNVNHFNFGQIFGESLALKGVPYSPVQVTALTNSIILFIDLRKLVLSSDRCNQNCVYNHQLLLNLMGRMAEQTIFSNLKLRILSQKSLRDRIMIYLTHMHADTPNGAEIPFSQTSLSEFLNVNRSALTRELSRMQDEGILKLSKKHYWIISK